MRHAIAKHGSYEKFEESSGGNKMTRIQILDWVKKYLKQEDMEDEVQVGCVLDLLINADPVHAQIFSCSDQGV
jgi:hypothetical protein